MNELAIFNKVDGRYPTYCSLEPKTFEEKTKFFNAMTNPISMSDLEPSDIVTLTNFYITETEYKNNKTGELEAGLRIILFDDEGAGYSSGSIGVYQSLMMLVAVFGQAPWNPGIKIFTEKIVKSDGQPVRTLRIAK